MGGNLLRTKFEKVRCFQVHTPKLVNSDYDDERYDHEHFVDFIENCIMAIPLESRGWDNSGKFMVLEEFEQINEDFYVGKFISGRYGQITDYRHRRTFARRASNKTLDEGEENSTYFVLQISTGKLFLQSDGQRLVTKNSIDKYFRSKLDLFEQRISDINRQISPLIITPKNLYVIRTIVSDSFIREITTLVRIKKVTFKVKFDVDMNNSVMQAMRAQTENIQHLDQFEYSIVNKQRGGGMRRVEDFLQYLEEMDKYENIIVEGPNNAGRTKAVKLEEHAVDFDVKVRVNENGIISSDDLFEGIINNVRRGTY